MSSVIILSSSPQTFARSPTPAASSSPLPSPRTLFSSQTTQRTPKKFKTANVQRDGFSTAFSTARSLLGTRIGAENIPIRSPRTNSSDLKLLSPKRFKSTAASALFGRDDRRSRVYGEDPINEDCAGSTLSTSRKDLIKRAAGNSTTNIRATPEMETALEPEIERESDVETTRNTQWPLSSSSDHESCAYHNKQHSAEKEERGMSPLNIDFAVSRRTDWTPAKGTTIATEDDSPSVGFSKSFSSDLLGSFGYFGDTAVVTSASTHEIDIAPTKKRKLETVKCTASKMPPPNAVSTKRAKIPPKKALTITGLATSNYLGKDISESEPTALDQFLSTQAQEIETTHGDMIAEEVAKVKKAAQKRKANKRVAKRPTLVSPESAMRSVERQDAIFGSASQLARDESPRLLRDTMEAMQRSVSHNISSPVRTQDTAPISIESVTPKAANGISRFAKTRGLWQAAGRDEDNALLHVDVIDIDIFDTPDLRSAFPGKDVLIQASSVRDRNSRSPEKLSPSLRRGDDRLYTNDERSWDIDVMKSPVGHLQKQNLSGVQVRAIHTTAVTSSPRRRGPAPPNPPIDSDCVSLPVNIGETNSKNVLKKKTPKKPAFAGFTTEKLQKQIAAYGFKPMKKREHMIALLEKCWNQKYSQTQADGIELPVVELEDSRNHADHLTAVHGLAARRVAKEKKVPKPRKSKDSDELKPRKKREPKIANGDDSNTTKVVRKRKSKSSLAGKKAGADDDTVYPAPDAEVLTEEAMDAIAQRAMERSRGGKQPLTYAEGERCAKVSKKNVPGSTTLPPVLNADDADSSFAPPNSLPQVSSTSSTLPTASTDVDTQISRAVTSYKAPPGTNHQKDPTWHEKMLMYDPIVLEDLALWLNTVGLGAIGEDREVSALQVRDWCEKRGICCLWKGGWRGNKAIKE